MPWRIFASCSTLHTIVFFYENSCATKRKGRLHAVIIKLIFKYGETAIIYNNCHAFKLDCVSWSRIPWKSLKWIHLTEISMWAPLGKVEHECVRLSHCIRGHYNENLLSFRYTESITIITTFDDIAIAIINGDVRNLSFMRPIMGDASCDIPLDILRHVHKKSKCQVLPRQVASLVGHLLGEPIILKDSRASSCFKVLTSAIANQFIVLANIEDFVSKFLEIVLACRRSQVARILNLCSANQLWQFVNWRGFLEHWKKYMHDD